MLYGGKDYILSNSIYYLSIKEEPDPCVITKVGDMDIPALFHETMAPVLLDDRVISLSKENNIHVFFREKYIWKTYPKELWLES